MGIGRITDVLIAAVRALRCLRSGGDPWQCAAPLGDLLPGHRPAEVRGARAPGREAHMFMHHRPHQVVRIAGNPMLAFFVFVESVFWALAATCFLYGLHRIATALRTESRIRALKEMGDAYTDEEREHLVRAIKTRTLGVL